MPDLATALAVDVVLHEHRGERRLLLDHDLVTLSEGKVVLEVVFDRASLSSSSTSIRVSPPFLRIWAVNQLTGPGVPIRPNPCPQTRRRVNSSA